MTIKYALTVLVALLAVACGGSVQAPDTWTGSVNLSALPEDHAIVVETALSMWRAADSRITIHRDDSDPRAIPVRVGTTAQMSEDGAAGHYDSTGINVEPCDTANAFDRCLNIAAHEIGHALGAEHVEDPSAIMFHAVHDATALTPADVAAVRVQVGE